MISPDEWYSGRYSRKVYIILIESYLKKELSTKEFEYYFLIIFKNDSSNMSEQDYANLNRLFQAVEAFCPFDDIRDENDISETKLINECAAVLKVLRKAMQEKD